MKIGIVSKNDTGVDYHRLLKPFSLLADRYDITRCEGISSDVFDYNFDVVVFSRLLPIYKQRQFIKELQKRGTYVIVDVDDLWLLPNNHVASKSSKAMHKQQVEAILHSDEVWTTHEHLGGYINNLNRNWHVIPNAIDPNEAQWQPKKTYSNRIGWAGGVTHFHDLMLTDGCWSETTPVICGFNKTDPEWLRLANSFKADYIEALDVFNYGYLYDQFDIAIAPLEDNKFTRCKSNLKIIEAGMKGLPIFVQNIHPYTDDTKGVYKVANWKDAIHQAEQMVVERIMEDGQSLREYVLANYDLNKVNERRTRRL